VARTISRGYRYLANLRCRYLSSRARLAPTATPQFIEQATNSNVTVIDTYHARISIISLSVYITSPISPSFTHYHQPETLNILQSSFPKSKKMQSNLKEHTPTFAEKKSENSSIDLALQQSGIQIGEILTTDVTYEEDRKILRKIDRL
jgi:hypothetical protein